MINNPYTETALRKMQSVVDPFTIEIQGYDADRDRITFTIQHEQMDLIEPDHWTWDGWAQVEFRTRRESEPVAFSGLTDETLYATRTYIDAHIDADRIQVHNINTGYSLPILTVLLAYKLQDLIDQKDHEFFKNENQ